MALRSPFTLPQTSLLFTALALSATVSLFIGGLGAAHSSKDLQWGASHLLLQHADPYAEALAGYPHSLPHFSPPNYLPEFYLLILPLAWLGFHTAAVTWCVLTLLLSVASMALLEKIFQLPRTYSIALLLLLWCSAPFRTMLQVGQMSLLELFLFCLVFYAAQGPAGLVLGLSFAKYSFSPVALSWLLFRRRIRIVLLSLTLPLLGVLIAWTFIGGHLLNLCIEPLQVSRVSVWPGMADLMTITEYGLQRTGVTVSFASVASYVVALIGAIAFSFVLRHKRMSAGAQFVLVAVASLFTFKHLIYDYVFLLVPLCYAASTKGRPLLKPVAMAIGFFWFAIASVPRLRYHAVPTTLEWMGFVLTFAALAALLLCLTRQIPRIEESMLRESTEEESDPAPAIIAAPTSAGTRGILTLAFGSPRYIEMAKSLARSLLLHDPGLPRAIVTDSTDPELATLFTHVLPLRREYGSNVRQKLFLDDYTPFEETLFIDSDCLAVRPLDDFWLAFQDVPFGVCGQRILYAGETDEYLDVGFILRRFHLSGLPKFNGGIYYFRRTLEAIRLFDTARDLMNHATELHFTDFRGDGPADEALFSVAMALHGLTVTDMGLGGMWTPIDATSRLQVDVPNGLCFFTKRGRRLAPHILHAATFTGSLFYLRECAKLRQTPPHLSRTRELQLRTTAMALWIRCKTAGLARRLRIVQRPLQPIAIARNT